MVKRGQQEIAGFVIIVVLVVVAAFIFMLLSLGNKQDSKDSVEVQNLLDALWDHTTGCVIDVLPLSVGELFDRAYGMNAQCKGGLSSKDYLNQTVYELMDNVLTIEPRFNMYRIDVYDNDNNLLGMYYKGDCGNNEIIGADRMIPGKLRVELSVCLDVNY